MNMHKRIRLTPLDRKEIWSMYQTQKYSVQFMADKFRVSRQTIYNTIKRCRLMEFVLRDSTNTRYKSDKYGIKRLAKIEREIELRLKSQAKRYNKSYPGEMVHVDTKRLSAIKGEVAREYLFVGIDDFSRELYADILPDKSQFSSTSFLHRLVDECPYTIECIYSDNGHGYKGTLVLTCFLIIELSTKIYHMIKLTSV